MIAFIDDAYYSSYAALIEMMARRTRMAGGDGEVDSLFFLPINIGEIHELSEEEKIVNTGLGTWRFSDGSINEHAQQELDMFNELMEEIQDTEEHPFRDMRYTYKLKNKKILFKEATENAEKEGGILLNVRFCRKYMEIVIPKYNKNDGTNKDYADVIYDKLVNKGLESVFIPTTLLDGETINQKMKTMSGTDGSSFQSENTCITAIQRSESKPPESVILDENSIISIVESHHPVYMWYENGTIKWWSEAAKVEANSSIGRLCTSLRNLTDISGLADLDTSKVTDMKSVFARCSSLHNISILSKWDTSKVTDMPSMFSSCEALQSQDISALTEWDTSNVSDMRNMFWGCKKLANISALSGWKTCNVQTMQGIFDKCENLQDISALTRWDTSKVTDMSYVFYGCKKLTNVSALSEWKTCNVQTMQGIFYNCENLQDISALTGWDTSNVQTMYAIFDNCENLQDISALTRWDTSKVTDMSFAFYGCKKLTNVSALSEWKTCNVQIMHAIFYNCENLQDILALTRWDTSKVTDMSGAFQSCKDLCDASVLSNWDTSNVTNMASMFDRCPKLDRSKLPSWYK